MSSGRAPQTLDSLPWNAPNHFRLWFFGTVARLRSRWPQAGQELLFLAGYYAELDAGATAGLDTFARARGALAVEREFREAGQAFPPPEVIRG